MDTLSATDLKTLSRELKLRFVDCFAQTHGADDFANVMEVLTTQIAKHIVPGAFLRSGSRFEETMTKCHVGECTTDQADNDFMYIIDKECLNGPLMAIETNNPGFVRVLLNSNKNVHDVIARSFIEDGGEYQIQSMKVKLNFKGKIDGMIKACPDVSDAIKSIKELYNVSTVMVGPSVRLIFSPLDEELLPSLISYPEGALEDVAEEIKNAEVDFVPAFYMEGWPEQAAEWITRDRKWPGTDLVKKIESSGYHLVPKSSCKETEEYEWRISFSQAEGKLFRDIPRYSWCKQCYRIFKCVMKYHLSLPSVISSYHCKTLFLWTVEQYPPELWTDDNLGQFYLLLLDKLIHAIIQRRLPQFFIPKDNLFRNLENDFANTVLKYLSDMRLKPFEYTERRGLEPFDEEMQGMTVEEMVHWDEKPEEERYTFNQNTQSAVVEDSIAGTAIQ